LFNLGLSFDINIGRALSPQLMSSDCALLYLFPSAAKITKGWRGTCSPLPFTLGVVLRFAVVHLWHSYFKTLQLAIFSVEDQKKRALRTESGRHIQAAYRRASYRNEYSQIHDIHFSRILATCFGTLSQKGNCLHKSFMVKVDNSIAVT